MDDELRLGGYWKFMVVFVVSGYLCRLAVKHRLASNRKTRRPMSVG